jgi:hypothetical protein
MKDKVQLLNKQLFFVCFLLGISPALDEVLRTFRNPLSGPSSKAGRRIFFIQPLKMDLTEGSETSAKLNLMPDSSPSL